MRSTEAEYERMMLRRVKKIQKVQRIIFKNNSEMQLTQIPPDKPSKLERYAMMRFITERLRK
jgi:hypothetical protein